MSYLGPVGKENYNTRSQWIEIEPRKDLNFRYREIGTEIQLESRPGSSFDWLDAGRFKNKDAMYDEIKNELEIGEGE